MGLSCVISLRPDGEVRHATTNPGSSCAYIDVLGRQRRPVNNRRKATEHDVIDLLLIENPTHLKGVEFRHEAEACPRTTDSLARSMRFATRTISCARSATDMRSRSRI